MLPSPADHDEHIRPYVRIDRKAIRSVWVDVPDPGKQMFLVVDRSGTETISYEMLDGGDHITGSFDPQTCGAFGQQPPSGSPSCE